VAGHKEHPRADSTAISTLTLNNATPIVDIAFAIVQGSYCGTKVGCNTQGCLKEVSVISDSTRFHHCSSMTSDVLILPFTGVS